MEIGAETLARGDRTEEMERPDKELRIILNKL